MNTRLRQRIRTHSKVRDTRWRKMTEEQQDEFIKKKFAELGIDIDLRKQEWEASANE